MKKIITCLGLALCSAFSFAQSTDSYPNTFSSGSARVEQFTNKNRRFMDWSVQAGIGLPFMQSGDLTTIKNGNGKNIWGGYSFYASVNKAITHAFGLNLQFDMGQTYQGQSDIRDGIEGLRLGETVAGKTEFMAISLLGDVNLSNLLRRTDNMSPYRWALHGYAGVGTLGYKTYRRNYGSTQINMIHDQSLGLKSFFAQAGLGLKYKINRNLDLEGRAMYFFTGDDEFDASGANNEPGNEPYANIEEQVSDGMINLNIGVAYHFGKKVSHVMWHDPMQEIYYRIDALASRNVDVTVCKNGDKDNDGVCDDWDRQLNTPAGARVDGAGVALDTDLDGVIDLKDKCVTVAGPVSNNGCPVAEAPKAVVTAPKVVASVDIITEINKEFDGIEFELNKAVIRPKSFEKLDRAAGIIKTLDQKKRFLVIGATDTRGSAKANLILSQKRAAAVDAYLTRKGVPPSMLIPEGRGMNDLKYPECNPASNCEEWKNEANRRVYFAEKN